MAWVEIDLEAIRANARELASLLSPGTVLAPVIKANAYGHGAIWVSRVLAEEGYTIFCVATVDEGLGLRRAGLRARILVLYEAPAAAFDLAVRAGLELTIGSREGLSVASRSSPQARLHLKLDTGMTRQGLGEQDLGDLARSAPWLTRRLASVWTHMADGADNDVTRDQLARFDAIVDYLRPLGLVAPRHVAASATILSRLATDYEMARPGLCLFGVLPQEFVDQGIQSPVRMRAAMRVRARPLRLVTVPPGTRVGYGGSFVCARPTRVATLPIGYADGFFRSLGNGSWSALVRNQRAPIIGRVSMDAITVDVTEIPDARMGDLFTVLGASTATDLTCSAMARAAGTIPQEILVRWDRRLPYRVTGAGERPKGSK